MTGALGKNESGSQSDHSLLHDQSDAPEDGLAREPASGVGRLSGEEPTEVRLPDLGTETNTFQPDASEFDANDQTKISKIPVAAPAEYFRSVPLAELASMLEGKHLDHFAVEQMIGGGGMGAVFRGRDLRLDRAVAIKVIPAAKKDPETLRRFRLEAQAAARLDHPHIARVYYIGEAEQWNYIVFEFIDGINIRDLVSLDGPLSIDDAVYYTRQVAEALSHAYERDVVHRDIKPSNILVTSSGMVKLVDMGLARHTAMDQSSNDATASGVTLGTFDYISPEQARNPRDADVRSDLYSLGCTMFFMLTGKPPFSEGTVLQKLLKHGSVPPPDPRGWRDDISDQFYAILMKLMAKQPAARYQSPKDLISDLLMLAEVEDLPRSQLPGTVMFTPALAQRSLLETHLPWLVALAFLLGSTLWLQSVQAISTGFELPSIENKADRISASVSASEGRSREDIPADVRGETAPSTAADLPVVKDTATATGRQGETSSTFVVSQFRPANVPEQFWSNDLNAAISQLGGEEVAEVEVRGTVELDMPIQARDMRLRIRGNPEIRSAIEMSPSLVRELSDGGGIWNISNADVSFDGLELELKAGTDLPSTPLALFTSNGNSSLSLRDTVVTMVAEGTDANQTGLCVLRIEESPSVEESSSNVAYPDIDITCESSVVRGAATFVSLTADLAKNIPFSASFSGSLLVLQGWVLDVDANDGGLQAQTGRNLRLFCDSTTFYSESGFARLNYGATGEPVLSLNRTSQNCVYSSQPGSSHLVVTGLGSESMLVNLNRFLFKGSNNAYDDQIEIFCRCFDREDVEIFSFGFQSVSQDGWFEERGNERQIRWANPKRLNQRLSEMNRADFRIEEDRFVPGFQRKNTIPPL